MLRNYITIAFRNLTRNKVYSLINILGLALGITCCLLLSLYIADEMRYDRHHARLDDLYRIVTEFKGERGVDRLGTASPPIAMAMWEEVPEVDMAVRALRPPGVSLNLIRYNDNMFYETEGFIADSTFFDMFAYEFIAGNPHKSLVEAQSVVLADHLAEKLFGKESPLDKTIHINMGGPSADYRVTGVFKAEKHSILNPSFIISMMSAGWGAYIRTDPAASNEWAGNNFVPSYLRLVPGHDRAVVESKINQVLLNHGLEAMKALGFEKSLHLEPVKDIYLKSDVGRSPRINNLYIVAAIALFILVIASINFMNLSTAKAGKRATEIGIRKVMGAVRSSLVRQILGEALVIVGVSLMLSIGLLQLVLPLFNDLTGKVITLDTSATLFLILALAAIGIITGLLAGSYPALYLSSFQPAQVLKSKSGLASSNGILRQSLVVFQFITAIALGCGMLVIGNQLSFMQEKNLGFETGGRIMLPLRTRTATDAYGALTKELSKIPGVKQVSGANYMPGSMIWSDMLYYPEGGSMETALMHRRNSVDAGYLELMGIPIIAGRTFTDNREQEYRKIIVNRTSAKQFGFTPEEMVGRPLHFDWRGEHFTYEVIGVMEDYHHMSLKDEIFPLIFELPTEVTRYGFVVLSAQTNDFSGLLSELEAKWKVQISDTPFEYLFVDATIQKLYEDDRRVSAIMSSFTVVALIICCLGLYGLSSFMAERRFKEIGIRKVMGASLTQIAAMMSREFVKLVAIAFLLAAPLTWYAMTRWLETFAYHDPVNPWVFAIAGSTALAIALATVSFESLKAASANPVNSLRNE
jgi:putative ABC transport system permease protein